MTSKEIKRFGDLFIAIGQNLKNNPSFIEELEKLLDSHREIKQQKVIDFVKVNSLDLFQLIREKTENEISLILSEFNISELREFLKKYRFGSSSKLKTNNQIIDYIINQLKQRKTDVFHNSGFDTINNEGNK